MKGLFVGRFQPLHLGHLEAIRFCLRRVDHLYIVVGSAQKSHEPDNPFTVGERIEMLRRTLKEEGIPCERYTLIPVPDVESHRLWVPLLRLYVPEFEVAFSNDPLTVTLLREAGVKVVEVELKDREVLSATEVRRRMLEGEDWEALVPNPVSSYLKEIGGVERLKSISR